MAIYVGITALHRGAQVRVPAVSGFTNEVQNIAVDAAGGTFTITFDGETTAAIAYNAAGSAVTTALTNLSNLAPGDVVVTGGPGAAGGATPYVLTFGGTKAARDVPAVTTGAGSLTGGAGTAAVTTPTGGSATGTVAQTKLVPGTVTIVDLSDAKTRRALNQHSAIGQWVVVATHADVGGAELPANA